jgi:hypothetical protein
MYLIGRTGHHYVPCYFDIALRPMKVIAWMAICKIECATHCSAPVKSCDAAMP